MDFRDQDGNGEGLFGARNENSVLFSLDSLTSLDNDSSANSAGTGFGSSGDASGLIDLNTLAKMSNSGSSSDDEDAVPIMESTVFNQVVTKKSKRNVALIIAGFVLLAIAAGVTVYFVKSNADKAAAEKTALAEKEAQKAAADAQKAAADAEELQKKIKELEAAATDRTADEKKIQEELERLRAQKANIDAAAQANVAGGDSKGKKGGSAHANAGGDAAPAPAPAPAPTKKAPTAEEIKKGIADAQAKAGKCGKGGNLTVSLDLAGGSAKNVKAVGGSFAGSATEKCILTVIPKASWPDGNAKNVKFTIKL